MSHTVSVSELKNNTLAVMQMVKDAPVVLKHAGKPIAQIIPLEETDEWHDKILESMKEKPIGLEASEKLMQKLAAKANEA